MSPPSETTHKPTQKPVRRARRQPRKSAGSGPSSASSLQGAELSTDNGSDHQLSQPTRILRRGEVEALVDVFPTANVTTPPPHTPPRPKSMYAGAAKEQHESNNPGPEISQNRRKTPNTQCRKQSDAVSPLQFKNGVPISVPRRESLTPSRNNGTPTKAYAGPTFHASPAASSLPMPKFYSKSVPNEENTMSLKTMLEQESPDSGSGSEPSPLLENIQPVNSQRAIEESPLDVFFKADREAKGRASNSLKDYSSPESQANPFGSPSTPQPLSQRHLRPTSVGGMFTMEMDGASPELSSRAVSQDNARYDPEKYNMANPISSTLTEREREEQRKAQTIALKKLLYSPRPQLQHSGTAGQRPPSSKLRSELSLPTSPEHVDTPELPATPTPSRFNDPVVNSKNHKLPNGHTSPQFSFAPSANQAHDPKFTNKLMNPDSIENDLRRILKLDILGSDGVSGLRS